MEAKHSITKSSFVFRIFETRLISVENEEKTRKGEYRKIQIRKKWPTEIEKIKWEDRKQKRKREMKLNMVQKKKKKLMKPEEEKKIGKCRMNRWDEGETQDFGEFQTKLGNQTKEL